MRSQAARARRRTARPCARRLERARDGCAKERGRAIGRSGRAIAEVASCGAHAMGADEASAPFVAAVGALAFAPALAEVAGGAALGQAAGLLRDAGVVVVAASAVRSTVAAELGPDAPWTPVFRAAMRRAKAEGRCSELSLAASVGVTRWLDAGLRDAGWFAKEASAHAVDALVQRAPWAIAAELGSVAIGLVPYVSGVRALARAAADARATIALVELVRDEARANVQRRPAEVIDLSERRPRSPAPMVDGCTAELASNLG
jgi:hypothetical protein